MWAGGRATRRCLGRRVRRRLPRCSERRERRIAGVAQIDEIDAFDDAIAVGVEAGNDAVREAHACRLRDAVKKLAAEQPVRPRGRFFSGWNWTAKMFSPVRGTAAKFVAVIAQATASSLGVHRERHRSARSKNRRRREMPSSRREWAHAANWFHPMCGSLTVAGSDGQSPEKDSARAFAGFFARSVKRLQAEANAEKGNAAADRIEKRRAKILFDRARASARRSGRRREESGPRRLAMHSGEIGALRLRRRVVQARARRW